MGLEYELKYRATPAQLQQLLARYGAEAQTISMETTYYDTPTGALSARWYTLRRRLENGSSVCTLKAPAENDARGEWEVECDTIEAGLSALCKLDTPADLAELTREGLVQVCSARFTRVARLLEIPGGTVELAMDTGILLGGGKEEALCEVEVELKTGTTEAAAAFAADLAAQYALQPERRSKFRRALALALAKGE